MLRPGAGTQSRHLREGSVCGKSIGELRKRFTVHETQGSRDSIAVVSIGNQLVYRSQASMPFKSAFGQENVRKKS